MDISTQSKLWKVRQLIPSDFQEVIEIDQLCFEKPWTLNDIKDYYERLNHTGFVIINEGFIRAFTWHMLNNSHYRLLNIACHPDNMNEGYASRLITHLKARLVVGKRHFIICDVRESNLVAQLFLKKNEFTCVCIKDDYFDDGEPSYVMRYGL